jgi:hypothetical protein
MPEAVQPCREDPSTPLRMTTIPSVILSEAKDLVVETKQ